MGGARILADGEQCDAAHHQWGAFMAASETPEGVDETVSTLRKLGAVVMVVLELALAACTSAQTVPPTT